MFFYSKEIKNKNKQKYMKQNEQIFMHKIKWKLITDLVERVKVGYRDP